MQDLAGGNLSVADLAGGEKPVLVWFWAPHCPYCNAEAANVERFAKRNADRVQVVGLGTQDSVEEAQQFVREHGLKTPRMLYDTSFASWQQLGIRSQPAAMLFDRDGVARGSVVRPVRRGAGSRHCWEGVAVIIKRFVGPAYFAANGLLLGRAVLRRAAGPLATAGSVLAHAGPMVLLGSLYVRKQGRTSQELPLLRAAVATGAVLAAVPQPGRHRRALGALLAGVLGTEAYIRWYSVLGRTRSTSLELDGQFPTDVSFVDLDGAPVTGADLVGRPTAIFFYRGNWCPLCVAQVGEMAARWQQLEELGVDVVLISPQSDAHTRELADRFGVAFRYLRDPELRAARQLGLVHEGGVPPGLPGYEPDTVFPTVVVIDKDGRVILSDQTDNYRVRPEPDTILAALGAASA